MTGPQHFSAKDREKFRKLLEVANSTTYDGEKDAALAAATRLANAHGMSLREAAGMREDGRQEHPSAGHRHQKSKRAGTRPHEFGETFYTAKGAYHNQSEIQKEEKRRFDEAMAEAIQRGLKLDDPPKDARKTNYVRRSGTGGWRSRPDFIRVLLRETGMSAREIASTVGVSIHDVFKEKLLMR